MASPTNNNGPPPPPAAAAAAAAAADDDADVEKKGGDATTATATTTTILVVDPYALRDPLPPKVRPYDHVLLHFADGRQLFAQAIPPSGNDGGNSNRSYPQCKINKRAYLTHCLIGLSYGTVLEVGKERLVPLDEGEDLLPDFDEDRLGVVGVGNGNGENDDGDDDGGDDEDGNGGNAASSSSSSKLRHADNRDLVDDNTSQGLSYESVRRLASSPTSTGASIVAALVSNSSTFVTKTAFSKAKYVRRKQLKYQVRCRIARVTPSTLCSAMHLKDLRRMSNFREDTLGQVLSNANVSAGRRVLVADGGAMGVVTAGCVRRMGGYGSVISLFEGSAGSMHPGYCEGVVDRMNLTVSERQSLKWVNIAEVFCDRIAKDRQMESLRDAITGEIADVERRDRERITWPAPLQPHTREYAKNTLVEERKVEEFLSGRSARFARKLTRHSALELRALIDECRDGSEDYEYANVDGIETMAARHDDGPPRCDDDDDDDDDNGDERERDDRNDASSTSTSPRQCDSLIIATKYDPTATLFRLLPYLAPSCPFVVYHEFLEPLLHTFHALQNFRVPEKKKKKGKGGDNNVDGDAVGDDDDDADGNNENSSDVATDVASSADDDATQRRKKEKTATMTTTTTPMMLRHNIAINLRLTDSWFREYQVLEGRTHPNMTMSQNGGYLLTGTKLCPRTGTNELDEGELRERRAKLGGRRRQLTHQKKKNNKGGGGGGGKRKVAAVEGTGGDASKRKR